MPLNTFPQKSDIKIAFRKIALKYHPDRLQPNTPEYATYESKFKAANSAYKDLMRKIDV